ncbi:hypothetical protein [Paracoccus sp. (in: a-proteobacteria)]|uniref:hypothetical protein n=1 Tax=Paracoccus sp. TaxID=267 RepID=UPI002B00284A|nr:hypothetical protein [Paracoccus sp. (in: a-proteobacteria)]
MPTTVEMMAIWMLSIMPFHISDQREKSGGSMRAKISPAREKPAITRLPSILSVRTVAMT